MAQSPSLSTKYTYLTSFVAGGCAGLIVDITLFPIDTIKTRLQSETKFWRAGGFRGIYSGLSPVVAGSVPSAAIFFCTYETLKRQLLPHASGTQTHFVHMTSAAIGEMVSCIVRVPVEIAKQRRQVQQSHSAISILTQAYRTEGLRRGLYRGFGVTIMRELPFAFVQYPLWEYLKLNWTRFTGTTSTCATVAVCGAIAGGVAAGVTTPIDVVKTRIMLAQHRGEQRVRIGEIVKGILRQNGIRGLVAGFVPRVTLVTMGGAIFFGSYDLATKLVTKQLSDPL